MNKKDIMSLAKEVTVRDCMTNEFSIYEQRGIPVADIDSLKIIIKKLYENPAIKFNDASVKEEYKEKILNVFESIVKIETLFIGKLVGTGLKDVEGNEQYLYEILTLVMSVNESQEICFVEPMIIFYPTKNKDEFIEKLDFPSFLMKNMSKTKIIEVNGYFINGEAYEFIKHDIETTINKKIQLLMDDRGNFSYHDHNTIVKFYTEIIEILNDIKGSKCMYKISKDLESLDQLNNYKM